MMHFLATHLWLVPLLVTGLMVVLFIVFLATARGEDYMAGPLVIAFTVGVSVCAWALYALWHVIRWVF